jgi:hypothetical protein
LAVDRVLVEDVDLLRRRGLAAAGDRPGEFLDGGLGTAGEEQACALRRQFLGHRASDLAFDSEDDRGLVFQTPCAVCICHRRHDGSIPEISDGRLADAG